MGGACRGAGGWGGGGQLTLQESQIIRVFIVKNAHPFGDAPVVQVRVRLCESRPLRRPLEDGLGGHVVVQRLLRRIRRVGRAHGEGPREGPAEGERRAGRGPEGGAEEGCWAGHCGGGRGAGVRSVGLGWARGGRFEYVTETESIRWGVPGGQQRGGSKTPDEARRVRSWFRRRCSEVPRRPLACVGLDTRPRSPRAIGGPPVRSPHANTRPPHRPPKIIF